MENHKIYKMAVSAVYPHYIAKMEKKGQEPVKVEEAICWLTGYTPEEVRKHLSANTDFETFFTQAPQPNPERFRIKGSICGVKIEEIAHPVMREIRHLDKLIDDLAKGKNMEKILGKKVSES